MDDQARPITGNDFNRWGERLGNVEEMVDTPELRNQLATVREQARNIRSEIKNKGGKPDWVVIKNQIINPLSEVRDRVVEELARRGSREALVPIDRDPVPGQYADLVKLYYETLSSQKK